MTSSLKCATEFKMREFELTLFERHRDAEFLFGPPRFLQLLDYYGKCEPLHWRSRHDEHNISSAVKWIGFIHSAHVIQASASILPSSTAPQLLYNFEMRALACYTRSNQTNILCRKKMDFAFMPQDFVLRI
jgi:hypothetical protein